MIQLNQDCPLDKLELEDLDLILREGLHLHVNQKSDYDMIYEESQVIISYKYCISVLKIVFVLANSADPDKMRLYVAFHLSLQCLPKNLFRGFWSLKGYRC